MATPTASTKGILRPDAARRHFRLERKPPASDLGTWVERHRLVEWDLAEPFTQELLNHPSVNFAVEPAHAGVYGIRTERDRRTIAGRGRVVGVKFRPGAFQPFLGRSVHTLTNRVLAPADVFGPAADALADAVRAERDAPFALMEEFLRERLPPPDPNLDALAARHGLSMRTLQRLVRRYVGVSPKWVLKRYRLHEAAERIAEGAPAAGLRRRSSSATSTRRTSSATSRR